jgi:ABC-type amino acid transport substrate-binding protein
MHLTAFSLLTASSERGWLRLRSGRLLVWSAASVAAIACAMWLNYALVSWSISVSPAPGNRVAAMEPFFAGGAVADSTAATPNPSPRAPDESVLKRIERTGELRVGYLPENPPFTYRNESGALVGFEVDLAHRLAIELAADLVLVPYDTGSLQRDFANDHFDLAIGGRGSFVREADAYLESDPYLELHVALVVPDHRVDDYRSLAQMRSLKKLRLAYVDGELLARTSRGTGRYQIPGLEVVAVSSDEEYLRDENAAFDALLTTAETGAIHTMVYPEFSVVVPEGLRVRVPVVVAVARDDAFQRTVNRFMQIKRADGTIEALHEHWILGGAARSQGRRWSVARDVFGWGD